MYLLKVIVQEVLILAITEVVKEIFSDGNKRKRMEGEG